MEDDIPFRAISLTKTIDLIERGILNTFFYVTLSFFNIILCRIILIYEFPDGLHSAVLSRNSLMLDLPRSLH